LDHRATETSMKKQDLGNLFAAMKEASRRGLRIGQMIENLKYFKEPCGDLFHLSDDELADEIIKYLNGHVRDPDD